VERALFKNVNTMTILHLSDTHGFHRQLESLPAADVLVHSGDFSVAGSEQEILDFLEWFIGLPHRHKVFVAGNHDDYLYDANIDGLPDSCHYLCHSGVEIEGIHFYGIPMFVQDDLSGEYDKMIQSVPHDTDVLITHQPPYGILDLSGGIHYGSKELLAVVSAVNPRYHLFGHIHAAAGLQELGGTTFANAALVDERYKLQYWPLYLHFE
jgi:Icc-related predicted phosphoesterase